MRRTLNQTTANDFDMRLYRLLNEAEGHSGKVRPGMEAQWYAVKTRLVQARLLVRDMMHESDRKGTEG